MKKIKFRVIFIAAGIAMATPLFGQQAAPQPEKESKAQEAPKMVTPPAVVVKPVPAPASAISPKQEVKEINPQPKMSIPAKDFKTGPSAQSPNLPKDDSKPLLPSTVEKRVETQPAKPVKKTAVENTAVPSGPKIAPVDQ